MIYFQRVVNNNLVRDTSKLSIEIFKEHCSSFLSIEQREYMIGKYLTPSSIKNNMKNGREYFLIFSNLTLVGFYSIERHGKKIFLDQLCILKKFRMQGIGKGIIEKLINENSESESLYGYVCKLDKESLGFFKHESFKLSGDYKEDIGNDFVIEYRIIEYKIC